jgi:hypothetical protein
MQRYPKPLMIAALNGERRLFNDNPRYQRESGVWSTAKQQLLIDSLLNDYDIPKVYLHDLQDEYEAHRSQFKFAVIDGKQRLHAIWRFLSSEFPLADDFIFTGSSPPHPYLLHATSPGRLSRNWMPIGEPTLRARLSIRS